MVYTKEFKKILLSDPNAILGKKGISDEFINHINNLLNQYKIIKIKALKTIANKTNIKEIAKNVAAYTESYLLDVRGLKFIISREKMKKKQ
ncbi:MAG: YhbY family RNA-binding protein [Candidatus Hodarchaeota archaeon]